MKLPKLTAQEKRLLSEMHTEVGLSFRELPDVFDEEGRQMPDDLKGKLIKSLVNKWAVEHKGNTYRKRTQSEMIEIFIRNQ